MNTNVSSETPSASKGALGAIFLTVLIDLIGFSVIFPLFPAMLDYYVEREPAGSFFHRFIEWLRSFGAAHEAYLPVLFGGILGSLYSTLQFLCAPFWGRLSDRVGRRPVLLVSITGVALSYLLWFFSGSFALLVGARVLGGFMSGNISVATAAVADVTTRENRAKGMALIGIGFGLGFTLGPALGGALSIVDLTAWRPALEDWGVTPFSAGAGGALALSLLNLWWVATRFEETLAEPGRAAARGRTIDPRKLFGTAEFGGASRANLIYFIFFFAFSGMEFTLVFLAKDRFSFTPADNAWMFVFVGVLMALVQGGIVRRLAPRIGEKKLAISGVFLTIPGLLITGFAASTATLYLGLAFLATGGALVTPSLSALVSLYTPPDRQGEALGIFRSLGALARAVGPIVACVVYWHYGPSSPYLAAAVLLVLPLGLCWTLSQPRKEASPHASPPKGFAQE